MADMLPKLFFVHFRQTSFVAGHGDSIAGFLIGFVSHQEKRGDKEVLFPPYFRLFFLLILSFAYLILSP